MRAVANRAAAVVAAVTSVLLALTACSGTASNTTNGTVFQISTDTPRPAGDIDSFSWALYAEPDSLDYIRAFDYPNNLVLSNVCESLLRWMPDLSTAPGLAEKVTNPNPTTWVYTIRQGVRFHDGSTMTAADVVASLRRHMDEALGSYWASVYEHVRSIEQTGPSEVTVTLNQPDSLFNQYMAASPGTVESARTLAADGDQYGNPAKGVNCTGPFRLANWQQGSKVELTRFDDYWDPHLRPHAKSFEIDFINDPNAQISALQSGQVDGMWQIPTNGYNQLRASGQGDLYFGPNTTVVSEIVGNTQGVLGDKRVRQALLMATDRAGVVKIGERGFGEVAEAVVTRSTFGGHPASTVDPLFAVLPQYPYDVERAKALAKAAGVHGQRVVIATSPIAQDTDILTTAVAEAAKEIGLDPQIETVPPDKLSALYSDPNARKGYDLYFTLWYSSLQDPMETYAVLRTGDFSNYGNWSSKAYDAAANAAIAAPAGSAANLAAAAKAQQIAMDELPWLPMFTMPMSVFLSNRITGVHPSIAALYYPWAADIGARG